MLTSSFALTAEHYIGEEGGVTSFRNVRHVFYSNTAAPLVEELISKAGELAREDLLSLEDEISRHCYTPYIKRRWEALLDLVAKADKEKPSAKT